MFKKKEMVKKKSILIRTKTGKLLVFISNKLVNVFLFQNSLTLFFRPKYM